MFDQVVITRLAKLLVLAFLCTAYSSLEMQLLLCYRNCTLRVAAAVVLEPGERYIAEWQNPQEKLKQKGKLDFKQWWLLNEKGYDCTNQKEVGP